jgi:hypothetical protein
MASFGRLNKHVYNDTDGMDYEGLDIFGDGGQTTQQPSATYHKPVQRLSPQQQRALVIKERLQKKLERRKNL